MDASPGEGLSIQTDGQYVESTHDTISTDGIGADSTRRHAHLAPQSRNPRRKGTLPRKTHAKKRTFGLLARQKAQPRYIYSQAPAVNPSDYEQKYPEDPYGKEFEPEARVWKVYMDEAEVFDMELTEGWKDTVDVLLVFAGLFSAIVATLIGVSVQALQPDYLQVTVAILAELVAIQREMASGNSAAGVTPSSLSVDTLPAPTTGERWVNGLWFTSLAFALCTALIATIVKQWIQKYRAFTFGSTMDQVLHRQFRYMGLNSWRVPLVVDTLPSLIHISLFLFLAGLALFLVPLDYITSIMIIVITAGTCTLYLISNTLPLIFPQCPYKTPISSFIFTGLGATVDIVHYILQRILVRVHVDRTSPFLHVSRRQFSIEPVSVRWDKKIQANSFISSSKDMLKADAICWLSSTSSNPTVSTIIFQSIAGMPLNVDIQARHILRRQFQRIVYDTFYNYAYRVGDNQTPTELGKSEVLGRAMLQLSTPSQPLSQGSDHYAHSAVVKASKSLSRFAERDPQAHGRLLPLAYSTFFTACNQLTPFRAGGGHEIISHARILQLVASTPEDHPVVAVSLVTHGLREIISSDVTVKEDILADGVPWTLLAQIPPKSLSRPEWLETSSPDHSKWSLIVRYLALLLLPRSPNSEDHVDILTEVKEALRTSEYHVVTVGERYQLLTEALFCSLISLWQAHGPSPNGQSASRVFFDEEGPLDTLCASGQFRDVSSPEEGINAEFGATISNSIQKIILHAATNTNANASEDGLEPEVLLGIFAVLTSDSYYNRKLFFDVQYARTGIRILNLLASSLTRLNSVTSCPRFCDMEDVLDIGTMTLDVVMHYRSSDNRQCEPKEKEEEAIRFWNVLYSDEHETNAALFDQLCSRRIITSLLLLSTIPGKSGSYEAYFRQLRRLALLTDSHIVWRLALEDLLDVTADSDRHLVIPENLHSQGMQWITAELTNSATAQLTGLDFTLYRRFLLLSSDSTYVLTSGQKKVGINDKEWVVYPMEQESYEEYKLKAEETPHEIALSSKPHSIYILKRLMEWIRPKFAMSKRRKLIPNATELEV